MKKLFFFTLTNCKDKEECISKFCEKINKLQGFLSKLKMNDNILIFLFQYKISIHHFNNS